MNHKDSKKGRRTKDIFLREALFPGDLVFVFSKFLNRLRVLIFAATHYFMRANKIIIITAPSGAGKTSITRFLLNKYFSLAFSVSATTRSPRGTEQDGADYYFINIPAFQQHIQQSHFIEWEMVYEGKYYGTLKSELARIWNEAKTPLLDIDVQGAIHVQQQFPQDSFSIFIQPPSIETLRQRLLNRGTETEDSVQTRVNKASYELSFTHAFDTVIVNDNFELACKETEAAIQSFLGDALQ